MTRCDRCTGVYVFESVCVLWDIESTKIKHFENCFILSKIKQERVQGRLTWTVLHADCALKFCATTLGRTAKKRHASVLVTTKKYVGIKLTNVSSASAGN